MDAIHRAGMPIIAVALATLLLVTRSPPAESDGSGERPPTLHERYETRRLLDELQVLADESRALEARIAKALELLPRLEGRCSGEDLKYVLRGMRMHERELRQERAQRMEALSDLWNARNFGNRRD